MQNIDLIIPLFNLQTVLIMFCLTITVVYKCSNKKKFTDITL
jgi:hypothetical protein